MFGILRWWRERGRQIFHFHDGTQSRRADPLHVWMLLQTDDALEMPRHIQELESENNRTSAEAGLVVVRAVRRAFGLREYNDNGTTDQECIDILRMYLEWLGVQKKTSNWSLTSQQPMASCLPVCHATTC